MTLSPSVHQWSAIAFVAALAVVGEVMIASGMRQLGDLDDIRARRGLLGTIAAVLTNARFVIGRTVHGAELLLDAVRAEHRGTVA